MIDLCEWSYYGAKRLMCKSRAGPPPAGCCAGGECTMQKKSPPLLPPATVAIQPDGEPRLAVKEPKA